MKLEWNPLDIKPVGELTLYGDARPLEAIRKGDLVLVHYTPYRVTGITDDGDSMTYKLESAWLDGDERPAEPRPASAAPPGTSPPSSA
ncbi:MAG TPA: hypothetical protein VK586_24095 [Streptosporangiaceae bacterium]|nr:hypothetical protein [Streptosporangiaceae bacterium]